MFSIHITLKEFKNVTQQSPVILDLRLRKTQEGNHEIIVTSSFSKKLRF